MKQDLQLYINNKEVYLKEAPQILFTYQQTDFSNPTAVKNSFTKTITIEGVPSNNQLFNSIFDLSRVQSYNTDNYFNPSQRVPFQLFLDGNLLEQGYAKLDTIRKVGTKVEYDITLYGGLGDFFYNLTYDEEGNQRRLSDLVYLNSSDAENELTFTINKGTVRSAWSKLQSGSGDAKWDIINFMPAYNGLPENLDTNKILVNTNGFTSPLRKIEGSSVSEITGFPTTLNSTYRLYSGYGLATSAKDMTEWDMRDLRSYNQRPCLSVKGLLQAIAKPENNGGYTVNFDSNFFYENNKYYKDAWITLPMLSDLDVESNEGDWNISISQTTTYNGWYNTKYTLSSDSAIDSGTTELTARFKVNITPSNCPVNTLYTSAILTTNGSKQYGAIALQLVGLDSGGNVVTGSNSVFLTSKVGSDYLQPSAAGYRPAYSSSSTVYSFGAFQKTANNVFTWPNEIVLTMDTSSVSIASTALYVTTTANLTTVPTYSGGTAQSYESRRGKYYISTSVNTIETGVNAFVGKPSLTELEGSKIVDTSSSGIHSNARITKKDLLSIDGTPCDYLLSYCKIFGLFFEKDKYEKIIYIRRRETFYTGETVNIEKKIDRSKEISVTPLTFSTKWYDLAYTEGDDSEFLANYKGKYGLVYGKQKINTGFNFNSESTELLEGNAFKNGIDALEKSRYFKYRILNIDNEECPTFLYIPATYSLFNSNLENYDVTLTSPTTYIEGGYNGNAEGYDSYQKIQLHSTKYAPIEGSGVLVFYNGFKNHYGIGQASQHMPLNYYLTDDVQEMVTLNGNPCWLFTNSEYNKANQRIAYRYNSIPSFGRMNVADSDALALYSWDFGKVKELYIPGIRYYQGANIFSTYWERYISDLYSVDTRVVQCNVRLTVIDLQDAFRKFYWFDNNLWVLTKISDFDYTSNGTSKCTFVRVQDNMAYSFNLPT